MGCRFNIWFLLSFVVFQCYGQGPDEKRYTENNGQWHEDIFFRRSIPNGVMYLGEGRMSYLLTNHEDLDALYHLRHQHGGNEDTADVKRPDFIRKHYINVEFSGHNRLFGIKKEGSSLYNINYLKGDNPDKWASDVKSYDSITYQSIYDQIDWRIYNRSEHSKYEFIVHPKGSVGDIVLSIEGADKLFVEDGQLFIKTSVGFIVESPPYAYQIINGKKQEVSCEFVLNGEEVSYRVGKYNKRYELVIDPELIFSTLSGSTADNWGNSACVDKDGNLFGVGTVFSSDGFGGIDLNGFPATPGAFQESLNVDQGPVWSNTFTDIGVMKFSSDGSQLLYATYIGGRECDVPTSSIVDEDGNLYILTVTSSDNLPGAINSFSGGDYAVPGTYHSFPSGTDIAIIKLNQDGSSILSTRYVGGSKNDGVMEAFLGVSGSNRNNLVYNYGDQFRGDINLDSLGNVYVGSVTQSIDFPNENAFQTSFGGVIDGVAFKLTSDLSTVVWSTFIGGADLDAVYGILRDSENNLFVTGGTTSSDFPTTSGVLNESKIGGVDGFIARIDKEGDSLLASTILGTNTYDQTYFIQLDTADNAYVLGQTTGEYVVENSNYVQPNGGLFIHKITPTLDSTFYSTTIGTDWKSSGFNAIRPNISPTAFLVNECENVFLSGWGGATNGITAYRDYRVNQFVQISYNVFTVVNIFGTQVFPVSTRSMYTSPFAYKGEDDTDGSDFYLFVLQKDAEAPLYGSYYGAGNNVSAVNDHVDGGTSRFDRAGIVYQAVCADCGGRTLATDGFPVFPDDGNQGTYPKDNASGNCNNGLFKFDLANLEASFSYNTNCDTLLVNFQNQTLGGVDFEWVFGDGSDTLVTPNAVNVTHTYSAPGSYLVTLIATDLTTCIGKDTIVVPVEVFEVLEPGLYDYTQCFGLSVSIKGGYIATNYSYQWSPASAVESPGSPITNVLVSTSDTFLLTVTNPLGCSITDTVPVNLLLFDLDVSHQIMGNCEGRVPTTVFAHNGGDVRYTKWFLNGNQIGDVDTLSYVFENYGNYLVEAEIDSAGCVFNASENVTIDEVLVPNIFTPNNDGANDTYFVEGIDGTGNWDLVVYNRWGKQIFEAEAYDNTWNGGDLKAGTYYYLLTAPDESFCKGWVQIVR